MEKKKWYKTPSMAAEDAIEADNKRKKVKRTVRHYINLHIGQLKKQREIHQHAVRIAYASPWPIDCTAHKNKTKEINDIIRELDLVRKDVHAAKSSLIAFYNNPDDERLWNVIHWYRRLLVEQPTKYYARYLYAVYSEQEYTTYHRLECLVNLERAITLKGRDRFLLIGQVAQSRMIEGSEILKETKRLLDDIREEIRQRKAAKKGGTDLPVREGQL